MIFHELSTPDSQIYFRCNQLKMPLLGIGMFWHELCVAPRCVTRGQLNQPGFCVFRPLDKMQYPQHSLAKHFLLFIAVWLKMNALQCCLRKIKI